MSKKYKQMRNWFDRWLVFGTCPLLASSNYKNYQTREFKKNVEIWWIFPKDHHGHEPHYIFGAKNFLG